MFALRLGYGRGTMHLMHERTQSDAQRLNEIVLAFTPSVRRMCPHLTDDMLRGLVERMATRQLVAERTEARKRRTLTRSVDRPLLRAVS